MAYADSAGAEQVLHHAQSQGIELLLQERAEHEDISTDPAMDAFADFGHSWAEPVALVAALDDLGVQNHEDDGEARQKKSGMDRPLDKEGLQRRSAGLSGISVDDAIGLYLADAIRVPLLTKEEEVELAKQMERGREARLHLRDEGHTSQDGAQLRRLIAQGRRARDHLIMANTRLVVSVAKSYRGSGLPFEDLIQAGNVGLVKAADRFDYRLGNRFVTYAIWWVRQGILRALTDHGRTIRIPANLVGEIRRLKQTARGLEQELGRRPTPEEIAQEMADLEPEKVRWLLRAAQRPVSLDRPVNPRDGGGELADLIEDESTPSPSQAVLRHLLRDDVEGVLATLPPREARVLRLRFGLNGERSRSLREVGDLLGVTHERVRQIAARALRRMRRPRNRRKLRGYLR